MTTAQLARRVAALELARRDDDQVMTIAVELVDDAGGVVQTIPARPVPDWNNPHRRVDYRTELER